MKKSKTTAKVAKTAKRMKRTAGATATKVQKRARKTVARAANEAEGALMKAAEGSGRTLGRAVRGVKRVTSALKKNSASAGRRGRKSQAQRETDAMVELERAKTREFWKSQADSANAAQLARHGALVDERARVRSTMGMSWSNRKPR